MVASFEKRVTIKYLEELKKELEECGEHLLSETGLWYLEQAGKIREVIEIVEETELEPNSQFIKCCMLRKLKYDL